MKKNYNFIRPGAKVYWNDPANSEYGEYAEDHANTVYTVQSVNGNTHGHAIEDDDTILIYDPSEGYGEAEVPARELRPAEEFKNTPDCLKEFLAGCPSREPGCADPEVAVVVEDENGQTLPVVHAWYDKQLGMVRLTVEAVFQDNDEQE